MVSFFTFTFYTYFNTLLIHYSSIVIFKLEKNAGIFSTSLPQLTCVGGLGGYPGYLYLVFAVSQDAWKLSKPISPHFPRPDQQSQFYADHPFYPPPSPAALLPWSIMFTSVYLSSLVSGHDVHFPIHLHTSGPHHHFAGYFGIAV